MNFTIKLPNLTVDIIYQMRMTRNSFLKYLEYEKRYSPNTLIAYENDLKQFSEYMESVYGIGDTVQTEFMHVRSWIVELMSESVSTRSINRKLSTLKSYFKYLQKREFIDTNPMQKVIAPKAGKKLPVFLNSKQTEQLFSQIEFEDSFSGIRDRLILELLYATGMRRAELIFLKISDIDFKANRLTVLGKGNKERIIPFGGALKDVLFSYIEQRKLSFPQIATNKLILTNKGVPVYPKLVYNTVKKYLSQVTTLDKRSPHVLRHTFATHLMDKGADLNAVKELLGHSSLAATQVYTHNSIEKLKRAYKQAHPKAK